jgi:hypothetical protein
MATSRRGNRAGVAAVMSVALLAVGGAQAGHRAATAFTLAHFQCYTVDPGNHIRPPALRLKDQFGGASAKVRDTMTTFCAPVTKNGLRPRNTAAHLACYAFTSHTAFQRRRVSISNQFEKNTLMIVEQPSTLCLPSGKSRQPAVPPVQAGGLDHFQCYIIKPTRIHEDQRVKLVDQFAPSTAVAGRARLLCTPVDKNRTIARNPREHLVCYDLTTVATRFRPLKVRIMNQFGLQSLTVTAAERLCVPSLKKIV